MGLAPGRAPGGDGVRSRMRFGKPVTGKGRHHLPDARTDLRPDPRNLLGADDKAFAKGSHLFAGVEVAHRAPQQIGVGQRQPGEFMRHAQHLLLIQDHAQGLVEHWRQRRVDVLHRFGWMCSTGSRPRWRRT